MSSQELETITRVKETLNNLLAQAREQQHSNKESKHQLEMDWSDKFSAHHLDSRSVQLKNTRGNSMYKSGAATFQET